MPLDPLLGAPRPMPPDAPAAMVVVVPGGVPPAMSEGPSARRTLGAVRVATMAVVARASLSPGTTSPRAPPA